MSRTAQAIDWLQAAPGRTQAEAAQLYGIAQSGISAGLARQRGRTDPAVRRERLQCAILAELNGAPHVAALILKRG